MLRPDLLPPTPTAKVLMSWEGGWALLPGPGSEAQDPGDLRSQGRTLRQAAAPPGPLQSLCLSQLSPGRSAGGHCGPRPLRAASSLGVCSSSWFDPTCFPASGQLAGPVFWPPSPARAHCPLFGMAGGRPPPATPPTVQASPGGCPVGAWTAGRAWQPGLPPVRSGPSAGRALEGLLTGVVSRGRALVALWFGLPRTPLGRLCFCPCGPGQAGQGAGAQPTLVLLQLAMGQGCFSASRAVCQAAGCGGHPHVPRWPAAAWGGP